MSDVGRGEEEVYMRSTRGGGVARRSVGIAAGMAALVLLSGCSLWERSREDLLNDFGLRLPECGVEDVGSTGARDFGESDMRLHFVAPTPCAEQYLKDHGVDFALASTWPTSPVTVEGKTFPSAPPPFEKAVLRDLDLKLDSSKTYKLSTRFATEKGGGFDVLWENRGEKTAVYLVSVHGPR
ncbi:hypothetical protein ACFWBI_17260 [Streptomyces sp. NPDC059982]|uniref:hypothetical protein n=1 Tax=unclassified Streptomyces TaxID=2593676 RepID=UPI0036B1F7C2